MALVFNATEETINTQAAGNWFSFKPKQIKMMSDNIARFIATDRFYQGLVVLPQEFEDPEYKVSPEGKEKLMAAEMQGIDAYIKWLRERIANNQVSLRQDLEKANLKIDPAVLASPGELEAMRLVVKYQKSADDREQKKVEEVRRLMDKVNAT